MDKVNYHLLVSKAKGNKGFPGSYTWPGMACDAIAGGAYKNKDVSRSHNGNPKNNGDSRKRENSNAVGAA